MIKDTREEEKVFAILLSRNPSNLLYDISPSLLREGMYIKDILQADTSQLVHYARSYRSMCVSVSPMISIRIPVIYVQYPSFERDHPYYRVYISQCAAGRHEIALVIFLRCSAFTVLAGHRKEWRLRGGRRGIKQGYNKAAGPPPRWPSLSRVSRPFLLSFPCACIALLSTPRGKIEGGNDGNVPL